MTYKLEAKEVKGIERSCAELTDAVRVLNMGGNSIKANQKKLKRFVAVYITNNKKKPVLNRKNDEKRSDE